MRLVFLSLFLGTALALPLSGGMNLLFWHIAL